MVDVSAKSETSRRAMAESFVRLSLRDRGAAPEGEKLPKGNALETARLAGILRPRAPPT